MSPSCRLWPETSLSSDRRARKGLPVMAFDISAPRAAHLGPVTSGHLRCKDPDAFFRRLELLIDGCDEASAASPPPVSRDHIGLTVARRIEDVHHRKNGSAKSADATTQPLCFGLPTHGAQANRRDPGASRGRRADR